MRRPAGASLRDQFGLVGYLYQINSAEAGLRVGMALSVDFF